jgi:hypothetical protein
MASMPIAERLTPQVNELEQIDRSRYIPIRIGDRTFYIDAVVLDEEEEVAARKFGLKDFTESIGAVAEAMSDAITSGLRKVQPEKITVEFGCEVAVDAGILTAVLVKGAAKTNVKIAIEWTPQQQE